MPECDPLSGLKAEIQKLNSHLVVSKMMTASYSVCILGYKEIRRRVATLEEQVITREEGEKQ